MLSCKPFKGCNKRRNGSIPDNWEWCFANLSRDVINAEKGAFLITGNGILANLSRDVINAEKGVFLITGNGSLQTFQRMQ